ncbi:2056_t:CDS:1, partial [Cetraspora pellucida]
LKWKDNKLWYNVESEEGRAAFITSVVPNSWINYDNGNKEGEEDDAEDLLEVR